ncbi:MAG: hypothetical protein KDB90_13960 [Planctomycetes bacterium]|nr:hypothetical protein [Planctomycetota bacterium]
MHVFQSIMTGVVLCGVTAACATSPAVEKRAGAGEPAPFWRVEVKVREGQTDDGYRGLLAWLERVSFDAPEDITSAVEAAVGPREFMSWGFGGHFIGVSKSTRIKLESDELRHVVTATIMQLPTIDELAKDMSEADRAVLKLVDASPSFHEPYSWNPAALIRATNALWRLGKKRALKLLDEYLKLGTIKYEGASSGADEEFEYRAFPLLTTLFSGDLLGIGPGLGGTSSALCDSFGPICTVDGVPFVTHLGYTLLGMPELLPMYVERIQKDGRWREAEMAPAGSPLAAAVLVEERHREAGKKDHPDDAYGWMSGRIIMSYRLQALRCLDQDPLDPGWGGSQWRTCEWIAADAQFTALRKHYDDLGIKWDLDTAKFVIP